MTHVFNPTSGKYDNLTPEEFAARFPTVGAEDNAAFRQGAIQMFQAWAEERYGADWKESLPVSPLQQLLTKEG